MRSVRAGIAAAGLLLAAGCGGATNEAPTKQVMEQTALSDVGELYRMYEFQNKKPPKKLDDFKSMEMMSPIGLKAVQSGEVLVRLGAELPDLGEEPGKGSGDEVLAWQKEVPASGGQVLMLNRTIRTMTADEFKAARMAGTETGAPAPAGAPAKKK